MAIIYSLHIKAVLIYRNVAARLPCQPQSIQDAATTHTKKLVHLYILQLFPFDKNSCWKSTTSLVMKEGKGEKKCRNICCWSSGLQRYFGRTILTAPFLCAQSFRPITSGYSSRKSSYTPEPQLPAPPQPTHLNNGHPKPNSGHSYGYGNGTGHSQYNNPAGLYAHNGSTGDRSLPSKMGSLSISATHR